MAKLSIVRECVRCSGARIAVDHSPFSVPSKENLISADLLASTVTCAVFRPYLECQASTVYLPAGTLSSLNDPSAPVVWKNGWSVTTRNPVIHGCTSHLNLRFAVSVATLSFLMGGEPAGWPW